MRALNTKKSMCILIAFLVFTLLFQVSSASATASKEEAAGALAIAEKVVASAYNATVNAEQAGANVSSVLVRLNDAANELGRAEVAYREGDFNSTLNLANISYQVAEGVKIEADKLQLEALELRYIEAWFKTVVSIFAVAGVGLGSIWAWRLFKKRYYEHVLGMRPEAVSRES